MTGRCYSLIFAAILFLSGCASGPLSQTTDTVFMVSPDDFAFNPETAASNVFQNEPTSVLKSRGEAMAQFDGMVAKLRSEGIRVIEVNSRTDEKTPDAVFPNNWFSIHRDGIGSTVVLYPMLTPNRRAEVRPDVLKRNLEEHGIKISRIIDLTRYCSQNKALEGTGSLVLDRVHKVAFASLSPRTDEDVLKDFCTSTGYRQITFRSYNKGKLIYHTNVMMSLGADFAVICEESITDDAERAMVLAELKALGKRIVRISSEQMEHMCANILEVRDIDGNRKILMSTTAYSHFSDGQREDLGRSGKIVQVDVHTIEEIGGGSARCMVAEIFLTRMSFTSRRSFS
jgi:hypothetical protein